MAQDKKTRFVRIRGKIVPIRSDGKKKKKKSKPDDTKVKGIFGRQSVRKGAAAGSVIGAGLGFAATALTRSLPHTIIATAKGLVFGTGVGALVGTTKVAKRRKGETRKQLAKRVSRGSSV